MRKLLNDPFACVDEMVGGILVAYPGLVEATPSGRGLVYTGPTSNRKTRIVVGGGSGHEPAFFGYLGPGLADAAAVGNVFASPSAEPAVEAAERLAPADGVLFLYGNYGGDVMNFDMAAELLADRGVVSETVHGPRQTPMVRVRSLASRAAATTSASEPPSSARAPAALKTTTPPATPRRLPRSARDAEETSSVTSTVSDATPRSARSSAAMSKFMTSPP